MNFTTRTIVTMPVQWSENKVRVRKLKKMKIQKKIQQLLPKSYWKFC